MWKWFQIVTLPTERVQARLICYVLLINTEVNHYYDDEGEESWWEGKIVKQKKKTTMFVF